MAGNRDTKVLKSFTARALVFPSPRSIVFAGSIWDSILAGQSQVHNIPNRVTTSNLGGFSIGSVIWAVRVLNVATLPMRGVAALGYAQRSGEAVAAIGVAAGSYVSGFVDAIAGFTFQGGDYQPVFSSGYRGAWERLGHSDVVQFLTDLGEAEGTALLDEVILNFPTYESIREAFYDPLLKRCIQNVPSNDKKYILGLPDTDEPDNGPEEHSDAGSSLDQSGELGALGQLLETFESLTLNGADTETTIQALEGVVADIVSQAQETTDHTSGDDDHAFAWLETMNFVEQAEGEQAEDGNDVSDDTAPPTVNTASPMISDTPTEETADDLTNALTWLQSIHFVEHHDGDDVGDDDSDTSDDADHTPI